MAPRRAYTAFAVASAFQWLALGLAIAILVWLVHRWLREQPDKLDHEMVAARLDLATSLWTPSRNLAMQDW